ncbi:MAG: STAS domain-containing protein [candidate division KSB1 bacterium]|nr:STAS domain-containing protein [candidate division KSB1 bacterium]MDZ7412031.1 STAS domain-containing protein [candidate division KSB1 bacterium]
MELEEKRVGEVLVVTMRGKLMGGKDAETFREMLYRAISDGIVNVLVDMSQVSWMNSAGLGMLISGLTTMRSAGGDLRLIGLTEGTRRPLEITRLDAVFQVFASQEEGLRSFA